MRKLCCCLLLIICAGISAAQSLSIKPAAPVFSSLYTDLKRECRTLKEPKGVEPGDPAGACKGYGGYRIFISYSAWAATLSAESLKNRDESVTLGSDYFDYGAKSEKVEWRLANGKPFAVIIRLGKYKENNNGENPYTDKNRIGSALIIKGLKGYEQIDFTVDGASANANVKAREMADGNYVRK